MLKAGLVGLPTRYMSVATPMAPASMLDMIRQEPIPAEIMMIAPSTQATTEVSPIDPGMVPIMAEIQEVLAVTASRPPEAACDRGVAPENPSTATHTESPEICPDRRRTERPWQLAPG